MDTVTDIAALHTWRHTVGSIALVPTMGNLHAGHLSLVKEAKKYTPHVIVSIFVNRLQFGAGEDFARYPRTLEEDVQKLEQAGASLVFAPDEPTLYPPPVSPYTVEPPAIQNILCGAYRPGHFRGVTTVVAKLFNLTQPQFAVFGNKDFQQLFIIQNMVIALNFPIHIVPVATTRAEDGLALSSRNGYLSQAERQEAPRLYQHLQHIQHAVQAGNRNYPALTEAARHDLTNRGWKVDYVTVRCRYTLEPANESDQHLVILIAAHLGKTRLIDNIIFDISS